MTYFRLKRIKYKTEYKLQERAFFMWFNVTNGAEEPVTFSGFKCEVEHAAVEWLHYSTDVEWEWKS